MLLQDFLSRSASKFGDKDAIVHGKTRMSYSQLATQAMATAAWLTDNGCAKGARVAILTDDPCHYISSYFGILMSGGIVVGVNTLTSERSLDILIADCAPSFFLVSGRSRSYVDFLSGHSGTHQVKMIDEIPGDSSSPSIVPRISENDIAQILYTSGTTGKPKGVMLSHANLVANTASIISYLQLTENDSIMAVLPFFYSYGNSVMLTHIAAAGTMVVNQSFVYPNLILDQMVEERVTGLSGVPSTFSILLHRSAARDYSFPDLRYVTQAGAAMSPKLASQLMEIFPGTDIYIMYGQTEAAPRLSYLAPTEILRKPGSIGKAIPGVRLWVLKEDGTEAWPHEVGEIVAGGPNIMAGYWQQPEESARVLKDGKLWTGDLGYRDEEGFFFIVSRKTDIIKSGSHRLAPKEIEEVIAEFKGVAEVSVVGEEDDILGEKIHAFVVPSNESLSAKDITRFCRRQLPSFKVPHQVTIIDELPKSESGKVRKQDLLTRPSE